MKRATILFAAILLLAVAATAQNPKLSYSAVVRAPTNDLVVNQEVTVEVKIKNSETAAQWAYTEKHEAVHTNLNGLVTLTIGDGTDVSGDLADVDWKTAYITVTYTLYDGSMVTSTSPVNAVPYALYADNVSEELLSQFMDDQHVQSDWEEDISTNKAFIKNKPELSDVATSGNYSDLDDKPEINNGTLTITLSDGTVKTFTANQSDNESVDVPAMSAQDLLALVNGMTDEQKAALKEALGVNGGGGEPTTFICGTSTVSDHEGNVYNTVQIGTQCWTKENMRCTTSPSTGTYIVNNTSDQYTYTGKMAKWYNNDSATYAPKNYGLLYNWNAAVDTFNTDFGETSVNTSSSNAVSALFAGNRRGICPEGWHIPSNAEWTTLTDYMLSAQQGDDYLYRCDPTDPTSIAKALASATDDWENESGACYPGDQSVNTNDDSGFGAVPAGSYAMPFNYAGYSAFFWSSTQENYYYVWYRFLRHDRVGVNINTFYKTAGNSVRCLRDE